MPMTKEDRKARRKFRRKEARKLAGRAYDEVIKTLKWPSEKEFTLAGATNRQLVALCRVADRLFRLSITAGDRLDARYQLVLDNREREKELVAIERAEEAVTIARKAVDRMEKYEKEAIEPWTDHGGEG